MGHSMRDDELATEDVNIVASCQSDREMASAGKSRALGCLEAAIRASLVPRKQLADECEMTEQYFSKVAGGKQGDFLALIYRLRADIRKDFWQRMAALEAADPMESAVEQLTTAAIHFLKVRGVSFAPLRMAKASINATKRKVSA